MSQDTTETILNFYYAKGTIIFNHEQTEEILNNGKITSSKKRGKSFASGNAYSNGRGKITVSGTVKTETDDSGSSSDSDSDVEFKEKIDWIEKAITRCEEELARFKKVADNSFNGWIDRNNYLGMMTQAEQYRKELARIDQEVAKNPADSKLIEHQKTLRNALQDATLAAQEQKQSMIDLYKDGYQAILDKLNDLIAKRKEYLQQEKAQFEYEKSIRESTDNISAIEKQLSVYQLDNSEEGISYIII